MRAKDVMIRSLRMAWTNKQLWLFGFFVAAASSGSSGGDQQSVGSGGFEFQPWMILLIIAGAVIGLIGIFMHIVSE